MDWKLGGLILAAALTCSGAGHAQDASSTRLEGCRAKLKKAAELNLLTDMGYKGGKPSISVGRTWYQIDVTAKSGLAETAACFFLAGKTGKAITFPIYDGRTGKRIATWEFTRLEFD
jgi:hypothetical protein